jgi:hypothetical protein
MLRLQRLPALGRRASIARKVALTASLLAGTVYFLSEMGGHYPLKDWLFFSCVAYWLLTLAFNVACLSAGHALLRWLMPRGLPLRERVVLSIATGVFAFYLGAFLAGLMKLYGAPFFVVWPLLLAVGGARAVIRDARRTVGAIRGVRRLHFPRGSLVGPAFIASGAIALAIIYVVVMTPENVAFDARWYHLPIAENYVARHGVVPFPEGWLQGALPHLSSFLYTWAMLWPRADVVDRVILCSHIEFSLFLWTLYGVAVLTRRLVRRRRVPYAWVAVFLFPGIFLYDGNLNTTADHIAAFWAPPIFLALLRAWPALDWRPSLLLGALLAAAVGTKYQCASLAVFPALAVGVRALWLSLRHFSRPRSRPLGGALVVAAAVVVLWAPHWLKNLVYYGDPLYPLLHGKFPSHPWTPDNDQRFATMAAVNLWRPQGTLPARLLETLRAVWSFSFVPHDWGPTHGETPVFGSLFTLTMLALPFLQARARLWALYAAGNVGVLVWYWVSHQDRYLQALVPWFASATAAAIVLAWESGTLARLAVGALVASQVVWGGDIPFFGTHRMLNVSPLKVAMDRLTSGFERDLPRRKKAYGDLVDLGKTLPPNALVLVHDQEMHLGLQHASVSDSPDWQGGISYGRFRSPAELDDALKKLGITHIAMITGQSRDLDFLPGDIAFFDYVTSFARKPRKFGGWSLFELPAEPPPDDAYGDILWLGCGNKFPPGRYARADMMLPFYGPALRPFPPPRAPVSRTDQVRIDQETVSSTAVAVDPGCQSLRPSSLATEFSHVADRSKLEVWIRRREPRR